jgi:hypothetical protein
MEMTWYIILNHVGYWIIKGDYNQAKALAEKVMPAYNSISNYIDPKVAERLTYCGVLTEGRW